MASCPQCGAKLETPLGCGACGALLEPGDADPFALLGFELGARVDARELRRRLLRFSRIVHPDFHGTADPARRALAERNAARLNEAHAILSDDAARADWLVRRLGGPSESDERQMPQAFLMEVLEWNEALAEARAAPRDAPLPDQLERLAESWRAQREATLAEALARLEPLPAPGAPALRDVRQKLNAVRYLERALTELRALRLTRAAT